MNKNNRSEEVAMRLLIAASIGVTASEVARNYGISRERARQISVKYGIPTRRRPGFFDRVEDIKKSDIRKRHFCKNGVDREFILSINEEYGGKVYKAYREQRANAKKRGVEFSLTFLEWWELFKPFYLNRGRAKDKYVMSRYGDAGAYEKGNVFIQTLSENTKEYRKRITKGS